MGVGWIQVDGKCLGFRFASQPHLQAILKPFYVFIFQNVQGLICSMGYGELITNLVPDELVLAYKLLWA